ncbi:DUF2345 domain-containing protein, partial [Brenneria goodwinii]
FELRTDQWGAIRAGKGIFISAERRERAGSEQLDMQEAIAQLENARSEAQGLRHAELADIEKQTALLNETLKALKQQAVLISAPSGIAQVTPGSVQLSAGENLIATSGADGDISIGKSFRVAVRETLSLFAQRLGIKLLAAAGKVEVQAQSDAMDLLAQKQLTVASQDDRVVVTAKTELLLNCGGGYIRLKDGQIELGGPNNVLLKTAVVQRMSAASLNVPLPALPAVGPAVLELDLRDLDMSPVAHAAYTLTFEGGSVITGQLDENGYARHDDVPDEPANVHYELPPSKPEPQWDPWRSMLDESDIWVGTITGGNN